VLHEIGGMKNVTISMSEELARWLRVEAAEADVSVSRYLADLVADRKAAGDRREVARLSYRSRSGSDISGGGRYPSRDELHER
jgi:hypothetical protein